MAEETPRPQEPKKPLGNVQKTPAYYGQNRSLASRLRRTGVTALAGLTLASTPEKRQNYRPDMQQPQQERYQDDENPVQPLDVNQEEDDDEDEESEDDPADYSYDHSAQEEGDYTEQSPSGGSVQGLKARLRQLGMEALDDPVIKKEVHTFTWTWISSFITPAGFVSLPVATYMVVAGMLWKKDDPFYHIFSGVQILIIAAANLAIFMLFVFFLWLVGAVYCAVTLRGVVDTVQGYVGENTFCSEFGIIEVLKAAL